jgi:hypothetical protein
LVRTKCPLKPPKLSPSLFDMTRLTAVQDAWEIPTLDEMSLNAMCERYWAFSGTCGDRHRMFCSPGDCAEQLTKLSILAVGERI